MVLWEQYSVPEAANHGREGKCRPKTKVLFFVSLRKTLIVHIPSKFFQSQSINMGTAFDYAAVAHHLTAVGVSVYGKIDDAVAYRMR